MDLVECADGKVLVARTSESRVDARIAGEFKQQLLAAVDSGHGLIALDLSSVDFIDSSGLGAIVSALKHLGDRGDLVIVGAKPAVHNLFRLTRMDKVFRMYGGEADAIAALLH
ncbi:STAS domain-containing protein [bacterium]|nr:STAS domain-containing protein [bacterium]